MVDKMQMGVPRLPLRREAQILVSAVCAFAALGCLDGGARASRLRPFRSHEARRDPGRHQGHRLRQSAFVPATSTSSRRRGNADRDALRDARGHVCCAARAGPRRCSSRARKPRFPAGVIATIPPRATSRTSRSATQPTRNRNDQFTTQAVDTSNRPEAPPDGRAEHHGRLGPRAVRHRDAADRRRQPRAEEPHRGRRVRRSSRCATCRRRAGVRAP